MSSAFFLELLIRLYLTPPLLQLIVQKNTLERAAGVGNEIGRHNPGPLKHCPHYLKIDPQRLPTHSCLHCYGKYADYGMYCDTSTLHSRQTVRPLRAFLRKFPSVLINLLRVSRVLETACPISIR